ncbi:MAG: hypothetical protein ABI946_12430 [Chthoniobacterales bacterium]
MPGRLRDRARRPVNPAQFQQERIPQDTLGSRPTVKPARAGLLIFRGLGDAVDQAGGGRGQVLD